MNTDLPLAKNQFINGQWFPGEASSLALTNPSTGMKTGDWSIASNSQVDAALAAARQAFPAWAETPMAERVAVIERYAELIKQHAESLARLISTETGKPLWEARTEVGAMAGKIPISLKAHEDRCAEFGTSPSRVRFRPHGVVVVLGPFNFPGHLPNGHLVPALLAGNTAVFKPSELTPRIATAMVGLWQEAGLPPGVLNLVHGGGEIGIHLTEHPEPDGIFFTGSSRTGQAISISNASRPGRILALEMGGNNPLVLHQAGDLKASAFLIVQSAFLTAGQRCTCARRLIVVEDENTPLLLDMLLGLVESLRIGAPEDDPAPFMGPVISAQAAEAVISAHHKLLSLGAVSLLTPRLLKEGTGFVSPGILDVTGVEGIPDEETFGPLLQVVRVPDFETAIQEANRTRYGLSAGLLSTDVEAYDLFRTQVRAGIINWNQQLTGASGAAPFGGIGDSGNHRPSAFFAADYCSHPVASIEHPAPVLPDTLPPGINFSK